MIGTAGIGFDVPTFFSSILPSESMHYKLENIGRLDGKRYDPPVEIFDSRHGKDDIGKKQLSAVRESFSQSFTVPFGGAELRLSVKAPRNQFLNIYERALPASIMVSGLLFFGVLALYSRRVLFENSRLEAAVRRKTIELHSELLRSKGLERELIEVIDSERARIGRDLHDDLGQQLTAISLNAELLSIQLRKTDNKLSQDADKIGKYLADAMEHVRVLAGGLSPFVTDTEGLYFALQSLADSASRIDKIKCICDLENIEIHGSDAINLYRIAQESVTNAMRHGRATLIQIRLEKINGKTSLSITDNGRGFDERRCGTGMGMKTISQRALIVNYQLNIQSKPGAGTTIKVTEC